MKYPDPYRRRPGYLDVPGLYPQRRRLPHWPGWLWLVVAAVAVIPLVGVPGVVLAHYTTSDSSFCLTCHSTRETPDRSAPSTVHPTFDKVSCVDCHAKSGQVVFEGYVKGFMAEPERVSGNCLRCHSDMAQRTDQKGFKFNSRSIALNHQSHIERGATCLSCHSNIAHDLRAEKTNRPTMDSCYTCHSRAESCATCHQNGIPAVSSPLETVGRRPVVPAAAGPAPPANDEGKELFARQCASCHGPDGTALPTANLKSGSFLRERGAQELALATAQGKGGMPPFGTAKGGPLSEQQVKSIVDYLVSTAN